MKKVWMILICLIPLFASAQQLIAYRDCIEDGYDFWLYVPEDYNPNEYSKPVVMFLHGRTLSGNDLNTVRNYGCINAVERGVCIDALIVAPQAQGAWNPQKVHEVYEWVKSHYSVNSRRFYVIGMSMGGYGTLDYAATYPNEVAAAMAMCGGATVKSLCGLNDVPLWIVHGTADAAVSVNCSQRVVDEMCVCGDTSRLIFNKMKGVNHTRLARVFYLDQTYDWLFSHSLSDSARVANKSYTITNILLNNAYANLENKIDLEIIDNDLGINGKYYTVKKGDTLSKIAVENDTTVSILCKKNKMKKTDKLRVGRKIRVK
jgi:pimeloyl-ACP methyl ester carboxylesterase